MLDQESLTAYRQRWQAVAAIETAEHQAASIEERWRQLNALLRIAMALDFPIPHENARIDEGHRRWQTLTDHYLNSQDRA
ncbi:hypothetical protein MNBD_CHLOROFLEXI01-2431 [hydrothermal vent metagenome]|uniref:Uncharacterized protein n=1 Tax=hydrothermal vent metagenome TaxID=652676 RepID=A0A3B0ULS0_9ZZZZ